MQAILTVVVALLSMLNVFGGVIGGIWLAVLGEWRLFLMGLLASLVAPLPLGLAVVPGGLLFGLPGLKLLEKGHIILSAPFVFLSQAYTLAIVGIWCFGVFLFFMGKANDLPLWPMLLWSYSVAMAPWSYLAQKEMQTGGGQAESITLFFAQLAFVAMVLTGLIFGWHLSTLVAVFAGVLLIGAVVQTVISLAIAHEQRYLARPGW